MKMNHMMGIIFFIVSIPVCAAQENSVSPGEISAETEKKYFRVNPILTTDYRCVLTVSRRGGGALGGSVPVLSCL